MVKMVKINDLWHEHIKIVKKRMWNKKNKFWWGNTE